MLNASGPVLGPGHSKWPRHNCCPEEAPGPLATGRSLVWRHAVGLHQSLHAAWKSEGDVVSGQRTLPGEKPEDEVGISQTNGVWRYSRDEEHSKEQKWDLKTPGVKREHAQLSRAGEEEGEEPLHFWMYRRAKRWTESRISFFLGPSSHEKAIACFQNVDYDLCYLSSKEIRVYIRGPTMVFAWY